MFVPQWLTDIAAVVNAAAVLILVAVTAWYAWSTHRILRATKRQADVAEASLNVAQHQLQEQAQIGKMIIANAIQTATADIEYWKEIGVLNLAATRALPANIDLVPANAGSALEHASRISKEAAAELQAAFNCLRRARGELEMLRDGQQTSGDFYEKHTRSVIKWLEDAKVKIESASGKLRDEA